MTAWPAGTDLVVFDSIDSTNAEAHRRVEAGARGPLWIAAHRQTAGRGRHGRSWATEPGNLAASGIFPHDGALAGAARLSFPAALAVADVFEALVPGADVTLKWPNDVLLNRCKAAGILLETATTPANQRTVIIGIGLNLAHHPAPEESNWPPTSVAAQTGRPGDFDTALSLLASRLGHWIAMLDRGGFAPVREAWLARAAHRGWEIQVRLPGETLTGRFADLDESGALVLEGADGTRLITAGDVFFPEAV